MTQSPTTSRAPRPSLALRPWPLATLLLLAACSRPLAVAPGTPEAQVRARLGPPSAEYRIPAPQEGYRFEYDTWPMGRTTYMVDFGPDGHAVKVWQALTVNHFAQIRIGVDTVDSVSREFGRPDRVVPSRYGPDYPRWDYPFYEDGIWNSIMSITFDPKGVVKYTANGPDPRYLGGK
jgi:hypothetical protein